MPRIATQTRIELARVYLALGDFAGAETLIQEIDELLQRRPDLSSLADEAGVLQARLPEERCPSASGESALTCAELRLLPMLATHLTFPQIAATMSLSPNTITVSRRRTRSTGNWAPPRAEAVARSRQRAGPEACWLVFGYRRPWLCSEGTKIAMGRVIDELISRLSWPGSSSRGLRRRGQNQSATG
jgi:hypothetical protein